MSTSVNNTSNAESGNPGASEPSIRQLPVPNTPRDARIIALLLASMGVGIGLRRRRYTVDILSDAMVYANTLEEPMPHMAGCRGRSLAVQAKVRALDEWTDEQGFLLTLADNLNRTALPPIPERYGIRLPPEKDRLTAPNFDIAPKPPPADVEPQAIMRMACLVESMTTIVVIVIAIAILRWTSHL
ncbi:hypothetical protein H4Q26_013881 [Puccinia striiformis f. sp. tritici PST-130]|nr:hypothetical protein H4Q26_013881 [Puccinia striiformis f. sp. tritici PST-130]